MGKRSQVAVQKRRSFKRRQARQKKKEAKQERTVLNKEQSAPQSVSRGTSSLPPRRAPRPSRGDETAIVDDTACSPEQHFFSEDAGFQGSDDVAGDYATYSPPQCPSIASSDMSLWEADSPSNVDVEDSVMDGPRSESITDQVPIKAADGEVPMVVADKESVLLKFIFYLTNTEDQRF